MKEGFETQFLKETEQYYQKESNEFISSNSVVDYLVKVEKRFDEEQRRVQTYLDTSTAKKVEGKIRKLLNYFSK
jgi:cullin 1